MTTMNHEHPQRRELMRWHIKNPHALQKLDASQRKSLLGVLYRLFELYPIYLVWHLLGMKRLYWRAFRRLYMALHHGETLF